MFSSLDKLWETMCRTSFQVRDLGDCKTWRELYSSCEKIKEEKRKKSGMASRKKLEQLSEGILT